jgi:transcriptional/translational regulatory protein YebC/TACO1
MRSDGVPRGLELIPGIELNSVVSEPVALGEGEVHVLGLGVDVEDDALEAALDAGAEDFKAEDERYEITTDPTTMHTVRAALESKGYEIAEAEIASVPKNLVSVGGDTAESLVKLLEELEDLDDVQKVAANCDIEEVAG